MRYYLNYDIRRYMLRREVITLSQSCCYSYSSHAIIPRDKCNLHIICRVSSEHRLRRATTFVSSLAGIREFLLADIGKKRERWHFRRSLLGKSRGTVNRAADYSFTLCNLYPARFQT